LINAELGHVKNLIEFNEDIRKQHEEAHGEDYCQIFDAITKYMKECKTYMELGTHHGGTASAAMLTKPDRVLLVDIDMSRYNKFLASIAQEWCNQNNIELIVKEADSTSVDTTSITDMLVIDSYHHPKHMKKELNLHGSNVRKYIIAHDTSIVNGEPNDSLYQCMKQFADVNGWEVVERGTTNVGYTVLKKIQ
jgi:cephalosporin hydroxylase